MSDYTAPYTPEGKHPEDAIHEVKSFFKKLTDVQNDYFERLSKGLNLTEEGKDFLFDYVYNVSNDDQKIDDFGHYLETLGQNYKNLIIDSNQFHPINKNFNNDGFQKYLKECENKSCNLVSEKEYYNNSVNDLLTTDFGEFSPSLHMSSFEPDLETTFPSPFESEQVSSELDTITVKTKNTQPDNKI